MKRSPLRATELLALIALIALLSERLITQAQYQKASQQVLNQLVQ